MWTSKKERSGGKKGAARADAEKMKGVTLEFKCSLPLARCCDMNLELLHGSF